MVVPGTVYSIRSFFVDNEFVATRQRGKSAVDLFGRNNIRQPSRVHSMHKLVRKEFNPGLAWAKLRGQI